MLLPDLKSSLGGGVLQMGKSMKKSGIQKGLFCPHFQNMSILKKHVEGSRNRNRTQNPLKPLVTTSKPSQKSGQVSSIFNLVYSKQISGNSDAQYSVNVVLVLTVAAMSPTHNLPTHLYEKQLNKRKHTGAIEYNLRTSIH